MTNAAMRLAAPQLPDARISPAAAAVQAILARFLSVIVLMIAFSPVKPPRGQNARHDGRTQDTGTLEFFFRLFRETVLPLTGREYGGRIRTAAIAELAAAICRVDAPPVYMEQFLI